MKPVTTNYYTDPIVYKEGFFKNPQEEQVYLAQITERLEKEKVRLPKKGKKTIPSRS